MIDIWQLEKKIKAKGYSTCALVGDLDVYPRVYASQKHFNGGEIIFKFKCTSNLNVQTFDLCLSNRKDVEIWLKSNTVDELDNLLNKEELLHKTLESAIKTLREAESK